MVNGPLDVTHWGEGDEEELENNTIFWRQSASRELADPKYSVSMISQTSIAMISTQSFVKYCN